MKITVILIIIASLCAITGVTSYADNANWSNLQIKQISSQAEAGTVEIEGVSAGDFQPQLWENGKLNILPDVRCPLIAPKQSGTCRNIYAPSVVEVDGGWRVFFGGWDGVDTMNDRIYSMDTSDFLDFTDRHMVIDHGEFEHVCNVNAQRLPTGEWRLMCTTYPDAIGQNKPSVFTSPDCRTWNGIPEPYAAKMSDIIAMDGYKNYKDADINGMSVSLYEDGVYRMYFDDFKDWSQGLKTYRATSNNGKHYTFDGVALDFHSMVNDVKKIVLAKDTYYLMGLHRNGDSLYYSLSHDGMKFNKQRTLCKNLNDADRYIIAMGWVTQKQKVLGFLYGAGYSKYLDRNRLWARWLQKKVVFVAENGKRYEPSSAMGPDRQIIKLPKGSELNGHFEVYAEDGSTVLLKSYPGKLVAGGIYTISCTAKT